MNEKLLKFIESLYEYEEFKNLQYSLTINFKNLVESFRTEIFDIDSLNKIKELISNDKVKTFNFTLYEYYPDALNDKELKYNFDYNCYWYTVNYIFHGKKSINCDFNFLSSGLSINQLPENVKLNEKSVLKLIEISDFYKDSSNKMYKLFNDKD